MQPSRFVFHPSLPLTANGKVDRTALVSLHPETIPLPQAEEGTDGLEIALSRLWHTLLPEARRSPAEARFPMLGGDSLVLVNLMLGVEEITGQALEASDFLLLPTFAGLCQAVNNRMAQTEFQPVLTLRKQGTRPPLFFLHQQHGDLDHYFELAEALGEDQPVFGIRSPALQDLSRLPSSIEAAATEIIAFIRKVMPEGAPSLVGFSWSGLLAYEIARQLAETEGVFCFTALLGGDPPMPPTGYAARLLHFARYFPPWFLDFLLKGENRWQRLTTWPGIVRKGVAKAHLPLKFFNQNQISRHMLALTEKYYPSSKANLPLDLFRERESYAPYPHPLYAWQTSHLPDGGWNRWTRQRVRVHWVEGDHFTVLNRPAVTGLAQSILRAMDQHFVQPAPRVGSSAGLPALCPA
jgi:thioesterase domain-containing protein/acyl carrier protein